MLRSAIFASVALWAAAEVIDNSDPMDDDFYELHQSSKHPYALGAGPGAHRAPVSGDSVCMCVVPPPCRAGRHLKVVRSVFQHDDVSGQSSQQGPR